MHRLLLVLLPTLLSNPLLSTAAVLPGLGGSSSSAIASTPSPSSPSDPTSSDDPDTPRQFVHFDCSTTLEQASPIFKSTIENLHLQSLNTSAEGAPILNSKNTGPGAALKKINNRATSSQIPIDVYLHVVSTKARAGMVTNDQIKDQLATLNKAYNAHGIVFTLKGSDFTTNDAWAKGGDSNADMAMKKALRKGSYSTLNLYFQTDLAGGVLGKCTLPTNVGDGNVNPSTYAVDGCNIAAGTIPGGPVYGYNKGMTAVHETGHWMGLLHTFEGYSCSGNGDYVADTPAESVSTDGCPRNPAKDSCKGQRQGVDPINNFMDYSTDECYTRFSAGQGLRMKSLWGQFRKGK